MKVGVLKQPKTHFYSVHIFTTTLRLSNQTLMAIFDGKPKKITLSLD